MAAPCTLLLRPGTRLLQASQSQRQSAVCMATGIQGSIFKGLTKVFGQDVPGSQDAPQSRYFEDSAPSWEELSKVVAAERQRLDLQAPDLEAGPTNVRSLKRTFGSSEEPAITLYRDDAAWCPYCEKVILQLEEKKIPYNVVKINMRCYGPKPASYLAKVPSGLLPALEYKGELYTESATIMFLLENEFPDYTPLMPADKSPERQRAGRLLQVERALFSDWLQWLCSSWNHEGGRRNFFARMDQINDELGAEEGPYFLSSFSLVDCVFSPFLERIAASIPYYKGEIVRGAGRWPNLEAWFNAMETRPTFVNIRSDHYTHVHDLPPQLGGCHSCKGSEELAAAIDGTDGVSWALPLPPLNATSSPEAYSPGENPEQDRLRAAARLVENAPAVVKFAARGCGQPGTRRVTAPLSDPDAKPGQDHLDAVDAGLRSVAHALLKGTDRTTIKLADGAPFAGAETVSSLVYLRDRVGVPRDLPLAAARQLRAHLNWAIDSLQA